VTRLITKHFFTRSKKRAGFNKKTTREFYNKAIIRGLRIESFESRPLFFKYLKSITRPNCHIIIYNRYILICSDTNIAITLLNLPKEYYSLVDSIRKIKKEERNNDVAKHPNYKRSS